MTFPIDVNIPAANNDPADDQPLMQQNYANINSYLQVDHTNPAAVGAGQHKQVTFNSTNVPSVPTTPPVLFTNTQDGAGNALPNGLAELFYFSGSSAQSKSNYVATANGGTFMLGGIIVKWGTVVLPGTGTSQTVTYPVPFPNNCFVVNAIKTDTVSSATLSFLTNFVAATFQAVKSSSSSSLQISYIAIGN